MQKKKGGRNDNSKRGRHSNLLSEEKLGVEEEDVSLLINIGSMAAVALAPVGGGAVAGLTEDPRAPMLVAEAEYSARLRGGKEDEVWREEKVTLSLLFIAGSSGGSGLIAPAISVFCGGNSRTTCPTS